jgi:hypothetical protein
VLLILILYVGTEFKNSTGPFTGYDEKNKNIERQQWNEKSEFQTAGRSYYKLYPKAAS